MENIFNWLGKIRNKCKAILSEYSAMFASTENWD